MQVKVSVDPRKLGVGLCIEISIQGERRVIAEIKLVIESLTLRQKKFGSTKNYRTFFINFICDFIPVRLICLKEGKNTIINLPFLSKVAEQHKLWSQRKSY